MEAGEELAAQGGVHAANVVGVEQRESAHLGVVARHNVLGDRDLFRGAQQRDRSGGAEADLGDTSGQVGPQFAGPQRGVELVRATPGDPHQSEVAYGGTARFEFTFEMDDVVSATDGLVGVRRPEDSSAHNCNSHGTQRDHWSRPTGGRPGNAR